MNHIMGCRGKEEWNKGGRATRQAKAKQVGGLRGLVAGRAKRAGYTKDTQGGRGGGKDLQGSKGTQGGGRERGIYRVRRKEKEGTRERECCRCTGVLVCLWVWGPIGGLVGVIVMR